MSPPMRAGRPHRRARTKQSALARYWLITSRPDLPLLSQVSAVQFRLCISVRLDYEDLAKTLSAVVGHLCGLLARLWSCLAQIRPRISTTRAVSVPELRRRRRRRDLARPLLMNIVASQSFVGSRKWHGVKVSGGSVSLAGCR